ncbi:transcriptional regulator, ArsR family [Alteromonadaceae bacterium Bs31]|nr:transcriptional regulator, ArsR family [Alteromonadaceae bacterium Bs31]
MNAKLLPIDPTAPNTLSAKSLANLLKAAGDPLRVDILRALSTDSFGVLELCHLFAIKQSSMSHHLKVLAAAQLVTTRREGNSIFYRRRQLDDEQTRGLRDALNHAVDQLPLAEETEQRIDEIHQQRAIASQAFFSEHAERFKEKQDLIAAFEVYGQQVADLLQASPIASRKQVLEVGPGEGIFLKELSAHFEQVIALDNSSEMLNAAEQNCKSAGLSNVQFQLNDTSFCHSIPATLDCAVINMVLHHTPSPAQIFSDVSTALKPDAVLLVCDLCHHDQDWAREACGDIWLGFEPHDLSRWAKESNFTEGQSIYFALRNGFQIQVRQFIKEH